MNLLKYLYFRDTLNEDVSGCIRANSGGVEGFADITRGARHNFVLIYTQLLPDITEGQEWAVSER